MLMDAILKIHAKIMDEPLGHRRAAELAASGHKTELVPSSVKFAPKKKRRSTDPVTAQSADQDVQRAVETGGAR
jgi:hypothetical protein